MSVRFLGILAIGLGLAATTAWAQDKGPVQPQRPRVNPNPSDEKPPIPSQLATIPVPNVVDKTLNQARQILADAKLTFRTSTVVINGGNKSVIKQDPAAGTKVKAGTQVVLTVAQ